MLLVLDLDETLVRVRCEGVHHDRKPLQADFHVSVDVAKPPKSSVFECAVALRPGLEGFLRWIQEQRDAGAIEGPWIFTTSSPTYTKALLRRIDPGGRVFAMRVLARDACCPANMPGFLMKDLDRVPSKVSNAARRKVLVDNNPVSHVLQPDNAVLVRDWLGDNSADTELDRVRALLEEVLAGGRREASAADDGDYAAGLVRATPGHGGFRQRLEVLQEQLAAAAPTEVPLLRSALRAVAAECNSIKHQLLGAAP